MVVFGNFLLRLLLTYLFVVFLHCSSSCLLGNSSFEPSFLFFLLLPRVLLLLFFPKWFVFFHLHFWVVRFSFRTSVLPFLLPSCCILLEFLHRSGFDSLLYLIVGFNGSFWVVSFLSSFPCSPVLCLLFPVGLLLCFAFLFRSKTWVLFCKFLHRFYWHSLFHTHLIRWVTFHLACFFIHPNCQGIFFCYESSPTAFWFLFALHRVFKLESFLLLVYVPLLRILFYTVFQFVCSVVDRCFLFFSYLSVYYSILVLHPWLQSTLSVVSLSVVGLCFLPLVCLGYLIVTVLLFPVMFSYHVSLGFS